MNSVLESMVDPDTGGKRSTGLSCLAIVVLTIALILTSGLLLIRKGANDWKAQQFDLVREAIRKGTLIAGAPLPGSKPDWLASRWDDQNQAAIMQWANGKAVLTVLVKDQKAYGAYQISMEDGQDDRVFFWQEDECNQIMKALQSSAAP